MEASKASANLSTYVISLPESRDRRAVLMPVLHKHSASVHHVEAFDGRMQQSMAAV